MRGSANLPGGVLSGILQAEDIARMDLRGTEMVVLSACQTGQGRATAEGLYGLQRAFQEGWRRHPMRDVRCGASQGQGHPGFHDCIL